MTIIVVDAGAASVVKRRKHNSKWRHVCTHDEMDIYEFKLTAEEMQAEKGHMIPTDSGTHLLFEPLMFEKHGLTLSQFKTMWTQWSESLRPPTPQKGRKQLRVNISKSGNMKVSMVKKTKAKKNQTLVTEAEEEEEDDEDEEEDDEEEEEKEEVVSEYDSDVSSVSDGDSDVEDVEAVELPPVETQDDEK